MFRFILTFVFLASSLTLNAQTIDPPAQPLAPQINMYLAINGNCRPSDFGFNAATGEYGDMIELGILDPAKVTRTALQAAGSVAGLMITTKAMVSELPEETPAAAPAMPDMGGMGGMGGMPGMM